MRRLLRPLSPDGHASRAEAGYRCTGCGARWSYEAVRYVALCPECASGLVRVTEPDVAARSRQGRRAR
jgi:DNA-directed RNA polymerase subunit RPC12/RpoP